MTRYRVLRNNGCDIVSSAFISLMNTILGVPSGYIVFMTLVIEY